MLIVLRPQRHDHFRLALSLTLPLNPIKVLLVDHHLKLRRRLTLLFLFLSDKHDFGQVLNSIGYDIIDKLIVDPQKTNLQGLVSGRTSLHSDIRSRRGKLMQVGRDDFV